LKVDWEICFEMEGWEVGGDARTDPRWGLERRLVKWVLHQVTGTCEIERILEGERLHFSPRMSKAVSRSILLSRQLSQVRHIVFVERSFVFDTDATAIMITDRKRMDFNLRVTLALVMRDLKLANGCLGFLEKLRKESFDPDNKEHLGLLQNVWDNLQPGISSRNWQELGFSRTEMPWTDFRGMGMLGLRAMQTFVEEDAEIARRLLVKFEELPFGLTVINLVGFTFKVFQTRQLDHLFFTKKSLWKEGTFGEQTLKLFSHQFGLYLQEFLRFHSTKRLMSFNAELAEFENMVKKRLFSK